MLQFKARFFGYPVGGEAHDLRNTGSSHMICMVVGQRLGFDAVDYPEPNKWMYRHAGRLADLVNVAVVSQPHLFAE